jgi:predicted dithiol-disulfide oxidoreductase (DUF899 family)
MSAMGCTAVTNIVDQSSWLDARRELLEAEKALQIAHDELAARRRALGSVKLNSDYEFVGEQGSLSLANLFGEHSQLLIYHFMFHPDWDEGCKSCSFWADGFDAAISHLSARDVALAVVSRAPLDKLLAYRKRMGWTFPWVSSGDSSFNYDFNVSFSAEQLEEKNVRYNYRDGASVGSEMPGVSVFQRDDDGTVYHSYSTFSRGLDTLNPVYQLLDLVPKGRDEDSLPYPMDWVRRNDSY